MRARATMRSFSWMMSVSGGLAFSTLSFLLMYLQCCNTAISVLLMYLQCCDTAISVKGDLAAVD